MDFEGKAQSLLTFRVGPVLCCAPSLPVRSIITPPKLTHPPGSDSSQPGIFKHGSHIVKVLDLRQKFGVEKDQHAQPGNLIVTIFDEGGFAFWVDQILDVFDFPSSGWGDIPAAIPRGVFTRTLLLNKKIHLYSEFEKLATINNLGYLKHYIQQLTQQDNNIGSDKTVAVPEIKNKTHSEINSDVTHVIKNKQSIVTNKSPEKPVEEISKTTSSIQTKNPASSLAKEKVIRRPDFNTQSAINKPIDSKSTHKPLNTNKQEQTLSSKSFKASKTPNTSSASHSLHTPRFKHKDNPPPPQKLYEPHTLSTNNTNNDINEEESSSFILIFFFLFLLGSLATGLYFLLNDDKPIIAKYENTNTSSPYKSTQEFSSETSSEISDIIVAPSTGTQEPMEVIETETPALAQEEQPLKAEPTETEKTNSTEDYKADIIQQENEITITLHQPVVEETSPSDDTSLEAETETETETEIKEITQQPLKEKEIAEVETIETTTPPVEIIKPEIVTPTLKKEKVIREVIHIVVKGDTLWAIAKKYVHNPFLYPELARLSNIKNPHRIYPGNRVRIRFIKK